MVQTYLRMLHQGLKFFTIRKSPVVRVIFNVINSYFKGCVTSSHKEYDYHITHPRRGPYLQSSGWGGLIRRSCHPRSPRVQETLPAKELYIPVFDSRRSASQRSTRCRLRDEPRTCHRNSAESSQQGDGSASSPNTLCAGLRSVRPRPQRNDTLILPR